jgi:hypothetical protein
MAFSIKISPDGNTVNVRVIGRFDLLWGSPCGSTASQMRTGIRPTCSIWLRLPRFGTQGSLG